MTVIEKRSLEVTSKEGSLALTSEEGSPGMNAAEDGASGIIIE
jgi:hypothetical protein